MQSWQLELGCDLRGRWLAKMELQADGWPHYHIIVDMPDWVEFARKGAFDDHWSYGFSHVLHRGKLAYMVKYAVKPSACFEALERSGLPTRFVNWITTSHGFWSFHHHCDVDDREDVASEKKEVLDDVSSEDWSTEEALADSEGGHVIRVQACRETCTVLLLGCNAEGKEVVAETIEVPLTPGQLEEALIAVGGFHDEYDKTNLWCLTRRLWRRALDHLNLTEEVYRELYIFL